MYLQSRRELIHHLKTLNFKVGVEVGVRSGYFSKYMLENTGMIVHSVDPWNYLGCEDNPPPKETIEFATKVLKPFKERSIIHHGYSHEVCHEFENYSVDFVYLDALHEYNDIKKNLNEWYDKIKINGIFSGHDYSKEHWPGLIRAVHEFLKEKNINEQALYITGKDLPWNVINPYIEEIHDGGEASWWLVKNKA